MHMGDRNKMKFLVGLAPDESKAKTGCRWSRFLPLGWTEGPLRTLWATWPGFWTSQLCPTPTPTSYNRPSLQTRSSDARLPNGVLLFRHALIVSSSRRPSSFSPVPPPYFCSQRLTSVSTLPNMTPVILGTQVRDSMFLLSRAFGVTELLLSLLRDTNWISSQGGRLASRDTPRSTKYGLGCPSVLAFLLQTTRARFRLTRGAKQREKG
ncbi:hypothetical protein LZ30DRAFT_343959 [Colletotrichum cereale]|nr:hypothetical protein LZ30DRAFT_343959 [Colletotrichum cereale]